MSLACSLSRSFNFSYWDLQWNIQEVFQPPWTLVLLFSQHFYQQIVTEEEQTQPDHQEHSAQKCATPWEFILLAQLCGKLSKKPPDFWPCKPHERLLSIMNIFPGAWCYAFVNLDRTLFVAIFTRVPCIFVNFCINIFSPSPTCECGNGSDRPFVCLH